MAERVPGAVRTGSAAVCVAMLCPHCETREIPGGVSRWQGKRKTCGDAACQAAQFQVYKQTPEYKAVQARYQRKARERRRIAQGGVKPRAPQANGYPPRREDLPRLTAQQREIADMWEHSPTAMSTRALADRLGVSADAVNTAVRMHLDLEYARQ